MRILACTALVVLAMTGLAADAEAQRAPTAATEEIYVFRSHLASNIAAENGATPGCAGAGVPVRLERVYDFVTVETDTQTGRIVDADVEPAPGFTTCVGLVDEAGGFDMAIRGRIADTNYTSLVRCQVHGTDTPVPGLALLSCYGLLEDLGPGYLGGHMASSTLPTMASGPDVPGFTSTSIITMRLWRAQ